jgi:hypothetical protein
VRVAALLLAFLVVGCAPKDGPVAIRTRAQPTVVCMQARVGGTLVADPTYGLALQNPGYVNGAIWPYGFTARREAGVILLIGVAGQVVAREGDRILAAGGSAGDDAVGVDCHIRVVTSDATMAIAPVEDCGPLMGTGDTKVACITLVNATLGDRYAEFAEVRIAPAQDDCPGDTCTERAAIEARTWIVEALASDGTDFRWTCTYRDEVATCVPDTPN